MKSFCRPKLLFLQLNEKTKIIEALKDVQEQNDGLNEEVCGNN
jgi:hypothetical protein